MPSVGETGPRRAGRLSMTSSRLKRFWLGWRVMPLKCRMERRQARIPSQNMNRAATRLRSEEHTSELQSRLHLVCRLLLEKKKKKKKAKAIPPRRANSTALHGALA